MEGLVKGYGRTRTDGQNILVSYSITRMAIEERKTTEGSKKDLKGSWWSITINNPKASDYQELEMIKTKKWFRDWKAQLEQGTEESTVHIQGMLNTEYIRWSAVKKVLTRAHIEKARNHFALSNYVEKNETKVGEIASFTAALPTDIYEEVSMIYDTYEELETAYTAYNVERLSKSEKDNFALNLLDDAVSKLIKSGQQTVEFMCSNPSFRTAFKTYFLAIMYRQYGPQTQIQECPPPPPSPAQDD